MDFRGLINKESSDSEESEWGPLNQISRKSTCGIYLALKRGNLLDKGGFDDSSGVQFENFASENSAKNLDWKKVRSNRGKVPVLPHSLVAL